MKQIEKKYQASATPSMQYSCMDLPDCITAEEVIIEALNDEHQCILSELILLGWPLTKAEV